MYVNQDSSFILHDKRTTLELWTLTCSETPFMSGSLLTSHGYAPLRHQWKALHTHLHEFLSYILQKDSVALIYSNFSHRWHLECKSGLISTQWIHCWLSSFILQRLSFPTLTFLALDLMTKVIASMWEAAPFYFYPSQPWAVYCWWYIVEGRQQHNLYSDTGLRSGKW